MKVYVEPREQSQALWRVRDALIRYAPKSIKFVKIMDDADLVVLHVNGRCDRNHALAEHLSSRGQRYAVIQYCVQSTMRPSAKSWVRLWSGAAVVWSYLHLPGGMTNFYPAPLGVHHSFQWKPSPLGRPFLIGTSGHSWLTEGVKEAARAAWRVGGRVFHLGPQVSRDPRVTCFEGMNDKMLDRFWGACYFVSGLRRTEGFELPAIEGLVCGARPVVFDRAHYRKWYGDFAEYVSEGTREEVTDALEGLFRRPWREVTKAESDEARRRFDWARIVKGFWDRCNAG